VPSLPLPRSKEMRRLTKDLIRVNLLLQLSEPVFVTFPSSTSTSSLQLAVQPRPLIIVVEIKRVDSAAKTAASGRGGRMDGRVGVVGSRRSEGGHSERDFEEVKRVRREREEGER
jgi:hypothetical protein